MVRKVAERRTPRGLIEYFEDENENIYVSVNYSKLKLIGRRVYEPNGEKVFIIDDVIIDTEHVNGFDPPKTLPYPTQ